MKSIRYTSLALAVVAICTVVAMGAGVAHATPVINAAKDSVRVFNDCPVTVLNAPAPAYPALVHFDESGFVCGGGINLHIFNLSDDGGVSSALFSNKDAFTISSTITLRQLAGNTQVEAGLRVNPWFGPVADGVFNLRLPDGEIACFGGVLPFFSFTSAFGLHYANGVPARETIIYNPHCNTANDPGTIEYILDYGGGHFDSGPLAFGNCTVGEEAHGCYGIMDNARVGGKFQNDMFAFGADPNGANSVDYNDFIYTINAPPDCPVPTKVQTWGEIKGTYR
jgi:hypothetical protein